MKYMKRIISILIVAAMLVTFIPALAFADTETVVSADKIKAGDTIVLKNSDGSSVEFLVINPTNSNMNVDDKNMFVVTKANQNYATVSFINASLDAFYEKLAKDWDKYIVSTSINYDVDTQYFTHTVGASNFEKAKVFLLSYFEQKSLPTAIKNSCYEYFLRNSFTELPLSFLPRQMYYSGLIYDGILTDLVPKGIRPAMNLDSSALYFKQVGTGKYQVLTEYKPVEAKTFKLTFNVKIADAEILKEVKSINVQVTRCNWWKPYYGDFLPLADQVKKPINVVLSSKGATIECEVEKYDTEHTDIEKFPYFYSLDVVSYVLKNGKVVEAGKDCPYEAALTVKRGQASDFINKVEYPGITDTVYFDGEAQKGSLNLSIDYKSDSPALKNFKDIDPKAWYYDGVRFCVNNDYMNGISKTLFDPSGNTSRAMIATIIYRMEGSPKNKAKDVCTFEDVPANMWYSEAIRWAEAKGIVTGYSELEFKPDQLVTREQLAAILYRYAKYLDKNVKISKKTVLPFRDTADILDYAVEPVTWCYQSEIVDGISGRFEPQAYATRAQLATMIMRFCEFMDYEK